MDCFKKLISPYDVQMVVMNSKVRYAVNIFTVIKIIPRNTSPIKLKAFFNDIQSVFFITDSM